MRAGLLGGFAHQYAQPLQGTLLPRPPFPIGRRDHILTRLPPQPEQLGRAAERKQPHVRSDVHDESTSAAGQPHAAAKVQVCSEYFPVEVHSLLSAQHRRRAEIQPRSRHHDERGTTRGAVAGIPL